MFINKQILKSALHSRSSVRFVPGRSGSSDNRKKIISNMKLIKSNIKVMISNIKVIISNIQIRKFSACNVKTKGDVAKGCYNKMDGFINLYST